MTRGLTRVSALAKATTAVAIAALTVGITPGDARIRDGAPPSIIGTHAATGRGTSPPPLSATQRDGKSKASLRLGAARRSGARSLGATAQAGTNVVPNPGFEQGGCGGNTTIICGWAANPPISQDTTNPHSGSASMHADCGDGGCYGDSSNGPTGVGASAVCAAIGPGLHPASFWYRDAVGDQVTMGATLFPERRLHRICHIHQLDRLRRRRQWLA
jgi:hypothetical protein